MKTEGDYDELLVDCVCSQYCCWRGLFRELAKRTADYSPEEFAALRRSEPYKAFLTIMVKVREKELKKNRVCGCEPDRMVTIRVPRSMHNRLKIRAFELQTSMNILCTSYFLTEIEDYAVPKKVQEEEKEVSQPKTVAKE